MARRSLAGASKATPAGAQQFGGLVQRQAHDSRITAAQIRDEHRAEALNGVAARLVPRLAGVPIVARLRRGDGAEADFAAADAAVDPPGRGQRDRRQDLVGASRQTAAACARASAASLGLPRISPSMTTAVSAARTGAGPAAQAAPPPAPRPWPRRASRHRRRGASPGTTDSSISTSSTRNGMPICASSSRRRGDAEAR